MKISEYIMNETVRILLTFNNIFYASVLKIFNKYTGCIISKNKADKRLSVQVYNARILRMKLVKFLNYKVFNFILYLCILILAITRGTGNIL